MTRVPFPPSPARRHISQCGPLLSGDKPRGPQGGLCAVHVPPAPFSSGKPEKIGPALSLHRVLSPPPCLTRPQRGTELCPQWHVLDGAMFSRLQDAAGASSCFQHPQDLCGFAKQVLAFSLSHQGWMPPRRSLSITVCKMGTQIAVWT